MSGCSTCDSCEPSRSASQASVQLGFDLDVDRFDAVVALAGNPNTGKSTVFNALTGLRQHTGNWPGKTVSRAEGLFVYAAKRFKLVDLPGTYSLLSNSTDEEIARDFLLFGSPDCTVVVCDATVLERNLNLVLQILSITDRVVVCANLIDEANRKRIALEARAIEKELGVPVVPTAARKAQGLDHLQQHILEVATGQRVNQPKLPSLQPQLQAAVDELVPELLSLVPGLPCPQWVAMRLLEDDQNIEQALRDGSLAELVQSLSARQGQAVA